MTKKQLLIAGLVVALVALVGVAVFIAMMLFKPTESVPGTTPDPFGSSVLPGGTAPVQRPIDIQDKKGEVVSVPDFLTGKSFDQTPTGKSYTLYGPTDSVEGFTFSLQYTEAGAQFLILILAEPLGNSRLESERYLRGMLRLTDEELCSLNVAIIVDPALSAMYSTYENIGLSFCPGAVPLP